MKLYSKVRSYSGGSNPHLNGEIEAWLYIQELFKPSTVFDVGIETTSHIVDNRRSEETRIWLFEPNKNHISSLRKKYLDKKNVFIVNEGLGDVDNQNLNLYTSSGSIFFS